MISHIRLLQSSISQLLEYNKLEVFLEGRLHSIESDRMLILFELQDYYQPKIPRLDVSSKHCASICSTWYREVNMCKILMPFVSGINRQKEYCLSLA